MKTQLSEIRIVTSMQGVMLGRGKTWWEACCNSVVCSVRETTNIRDFITTFVGVFT